ncbi:hypothetical protein EW026_g2060 [Hermanssonia centrifuga]|uniref:Probable vacuolar protein sorting-associated protein 16 homolog n=1 Tax=Hermanssonia centrifuga TaxID=98765 RepID=A0A4S4KPG0_9APHY|nr:hypothetical protein EW026_g2060 [Hermanssonia centrifuga]
MRDTSKFVTLAGATTPFAKAQIHVYSPAGEGILLFSWDQGKIISFGWTIDERLAVLNEEGVYRLYDLQGDYQQYSLGNEAAEMGIIAARIHESGLVAFTSSLTLLEVKGWEGGKPLALSNPGLSQPPHSWAVIPPDLTISRHVEVLLSVDATVYSVDTLESTDQRLSRGPFTHLSPSPNGKSLALLTFSGTLWVVSTDFQRSLAEFDTTTVPGPVFAITESDGVRVIGPETCDFIQKVPASSVSVFRPGSTSPSAILYDAWEQFLKRSPKADESIRAIRPELATAVDECIDAAGREWEPYWQRRLLNAAKFGKAYLDLYDATDFVNMGRALKVLNAVRYYEIGIPITYAEYTQLSPSQLIARLTSRNLHLLALRVSSFLNLPPSAVLRHWAGAKIMRSRPTASSSNDTGLDDDTVCKSIVEKFEKIGGTGVSYAEIAKKAWEVGRTELATKLLDHEPRSSDQVPLLLSMKEDRLALEKAVESGDTDLGISAKRLALGNFFRLIEEGGPVLAPASRLLQVYAREQNREMLRDFYYSDDRRVEIAVLSLNEAATMSDPTAKVTAVKAAQKFFSEDKERSFEAKMMDESARLLAFQQQLEKEADGKISFFGLSVNETIRTCVINGMAKRAEKVKSDFKVPDKRFWYVKLHALTEIHDFEGLDTFARSKRSPIGYQPFVRHLVEKGHNKEAAAYVVRCDANKRIDLYVLCEDWRAAGKECKDRGDKAKLEYVITIFILMDINAYHFDRELRRTCPNSLLARELEQLATSMK